jgi:insulysin
MHMMVRFDYRNMSCLALNNKSSQNDAYLSLAGLAGLSYDVKVLARGVRLTFGGYNDRLLKFASYVSRKLSKDVKDLLPKSDNEFDRYKDQIMRALTSFDVKQPYAHASYYANLMLEPRRFQYSNRDLRDATRKITLPDLISYSGLWESGKGEALIQGNFYESEALELVDTITGVLPFKPISITDLPPRLQALPLPKVPANALPTCLLVAEPNPSDENAVAHLLIQNLSPTEKDHVLIELIGAIVREPFYNELRTKQQLGYIVSSGVRGLGDSRTLSFIVQSSVATVDVLTVAILNFLDLVEEKLLVKLSRGDVAVYTKSLIDRKTEPDKDLSVEVTRNWSEIASGRLQFDRPQKEAAALLDIEKEDIVEFWRELYSRDGRRALLTQVIPTVGVAASALPPATTGYGTKTMPENTIVVGVDDIEQFRRDREKISGKWIEIVKLP